MKLGLQLFIYSIHIRTSIKHSQYIIYGKKPAWENDMALLHPLRIIACLTQHIQYPLLWHGFSAINFKRCMVGSASKMNIMSEEGIKLLCHDQEPERG